LLFNKVPTATDSGSTMSRSLPVIIGGAVGALVLVLIVSVVSLLFVFKRRQSRYIVCVNFEYHNLPIKIAILLIVHIDFVVELVSIVLLYI